MVGSMRDVWHELWYDDKKRTYYVLIAILTCLVFYTGYRVLTYRQTKIVTLRSMTWENKIDVQTFSLVYESGWSLPADARLDHTAWEYYGTERYISGYRDVTDHRLYNCGTRKNPRTCYRNTTHREAIYSSRSVYRTKYYYTIDRWITTRQLVAHGTDNKPYWPNRSDLRTSSTIQYGSERTGITYSHYAVFFVDSDNYEYQADVTLSAYTGYIIGEHYTLTLNIFNIIMKIEKAW